MLWTVRLSFSSSKLLPVGDWAGLQQYGRLFANDRFLLSAINIGIFGVLFIGGCLVFGFLLAVFIDQRVRAEGVLRTVFLFPHAMSLVVTGLAWQWFLNPTLGLENLFRLLRGESRAEKRRSLLGHIEAHHQAGREYALTELESELARSDVDTYYLRNAIYLLHRIPSENGEDVARETAALERASARGQNI